MTDLLFFAWRFAIFSRKGSELWVIIPWSTRWITEVPLLGAENLVPFLEISGHLNLLVPGIPFLETYHYISWHKYFSLVGKIIVFETWKLFGLKFMEFHPSPFGLLPVEWPIPWVFSGTVYQKLISVSNFEFISVLLACRIPNLQGHYLDFIWFYVV